jgi:hypothetical protein
MLTRGLCTDVTTEAKRSFQAAIRSQLFTKGSLGMFENGYALLCALEENVKGTHLTHAVDDEFDRIVMGTVMAAILYEFRNEGSADQHKLLCQKYGLTHVYPHSWTKFLHNENLNDNSCKAIQTAILKLGALVLSRSYPLFNRGDFTKDSLVGNMISTLITEERLEYKYGVFSSYRQERLYVRGFEAQEAAHDRRHTLGVVLSILALFVPPLSLLLSIRAEMMMREDWRERQQRRATFNRYPTPIGESIASIMLAAVVPIYSSYKSVMAFRTIDRLSRQKDDIIEWQQGEDRSSASDIRQKFKSHKQKRKDVKLRRRDVSWAQLKDEDKKPKKVVVIGRRGHSKIYLDRPQEERWGLFESGGDHDLPGTSSPFGNSGNCDKTPAKASLVETFFRINHQKSIAILKKLEQQFGDELEIPAVKR